MMLVSWLCVSVCTLYGNNQLDIFSSVHFSSPKKEYITFSRKIVIKFKLQIK